MGYDDWKTTEPVDPYREDAPECEDCEGRGTVRAESTVIENDNWGVSRVVGGGVWTVRCEACDGTGKKTLKSEG